MIEGADELASVVTSALSPSEPLALTGTLTDALDSVWADFFGAVTPPGAMNWNAYSHEQLYDMVWQGADVEDVDAVAVEWGRHSSALTGIADALRRQGTALRSNWQDPAGESAVDRLAELSDRIWNTGTRAGTVGKAVANACDALTLARNTMPPPPPDPLTLMTSALGALDSARLFTSDATAGAAKAGAVRVMQRYEASLRDSARQVVPAHAVAASLPGETTSVAGFASGGPVAGRGATGVPWSRLVGGAPLGSQAPVIGQQTDEEHDVGRQKVVPPELSRRDRRADRADEGVGRDR